MSDVYICNMSGLPDRVERAIKVAVLRTWLRFKLKFPETFWIIIDDIREPGVAGRYTYPLDVIYLSGKYILDCDYDPAIKAVAIVAHEVTHKAQRSRSDNPLTEIHADPTEFHDGSWWEEEAEQVSIDVTHEIFPCVESATRGSNGKVYYPRQEVN